MAVRRIEARRAQDAGESWERSDRSLPESELRELREVVRAAQTILQSDVDPLFESMTDLAAARAALSTVWRLTRQALDGNRSSTEELTNTSDMLDLLDRVRAAEVRLAGARPERGGTALDVARRTLVRLGDTTSATALLDRVLPSVCELGFDRAILSTIRGRFWTTEAMCIPEDPQWASEIASVGRQPAQPLTSRIHESEIVRRRIPLIVYDVQKSQHVHRRIAEASLARSYVAAPIMPQGHVIGFLHGDCYFQRRHVDQFDRDVLAVFAMGFGYLLERNVLRDHIKSLQADLRSIGSRSRSALNEKLGPISLHSGDIGATGLRDEALAPPFPSWENAEPSETARRLLTWRELDVLKLMAHGETNSRIASRLVISEDTVKSHVKHILRKLGAANRAEAVSIFFQRATDGTSPKSWWLFH